MQRPVILDFIFGFLSIASSYIHMGGRGRRTCRQPASGRAHGRSPISLSLPWGCAISSLPAPYLPCRVVSSDHRAPPSFRFVVPRGSDQPLPDGRGSDRYRGSVRPLIHSRDSDTLRYFVTPSRRYCLVPRSDFRVGRGPITISGTISGNMLNWPGEGGKISVCRSFSGGWQKPHAAF